MLLILTQAVLVVLVGVYAMRASADLFVRQPFQPLMILAALAFVFALVLFHRPPIAVGPWLYLVLIACVAGTIVNGFLYFAPDQAHATPTNMAFSAVSIVGWAALGLNYGSILFNNTKTVG
jgi:hypothetical protein